MSKLALIAAATLFVSSSLAAQPVVVRANPEDLPTIRVPFGDLNLLSASGQKRLKNRIGQAASEVCDYGFSRMPLYQEMQARDCFTVARADGYKQMDRVLIARSAGLSLAASSIVISPR